MAPAQKPYHRSTLRKIIKAHSGKNLSKNVDILIYLDYSLFIQHLMKEAALESRKRGEKGVSARSVKVVTEDCLRRFKG